MWQLRLRSLFAALKCISVVVFVAADFEDSAVSVVVVVANVVVVVVAFAAAILVTNSIILLCSLFAYLPTAQCVPLIFFLIRIYLCTYISTCICV